MSPRFVVQLDHYYGDGFKDTRDRWDDFAREHIALGRDANVASRLSGGQGYRAGVMFPAFWKGFEVGGTVGAISGPSATFLFRVVDPVGNFAVSAEDDYQSRFSRALLEAKQRLPVGGNFGVTAGFGVGFAQGRIENDSQAAVFNVAPPENELESHSRSFSGLSYEIGAGISFQNQALNAEVGVFYAAFPQGKDVSPFLVSGLSQAASEFKWNPIGVRLTIEFL